MSHLASDTQACHKDSEQRGGRGHGGEQPAQPDRLDTVQENAAQVVRTVEDGRQQYAAPSTLVKPGKQYRQGDEPDQIAQERIAVLGQPGDEETGQVPARPKHAEDQTGRKRLTVFQQLRQCITAPTYLLPHHQEEQDDIDRPNRGKLGGERLT